MVQLDVAVHPPSMSFVKYQFGYLQGAEITPISHIECGDGQFASRGNAHLANHLLTLANYRGVSASVAGMRVKLIGFIIS